MTVEVIQHWPTWRLRLSRTTWYGWLRLFITRQHGSWGNHLTSKSRLSEWAYVGADVIQASRNLEPLGPTYTVTLSPMHQITMSLYFPQTFSTAIFWMTSCVPRRLCPRGMVWMPGKFMGMTWTLGSQVALPCNQPVYFILPPSFRFPGVLGPSTVKAVIYLNGSRVVICMQNRTQREWLHDSFPDTEIFFCLWI